MRFFGWIHHVVLLNALLGPQLFSSLKTCPNDVEDPHPRQLQIQPVYPDRNTAAQAETDIEVSLAIIERGE